MKEQLQTIMDTIVMPVVASLGGVAGIVAIVTAIAKVVTGARANNKAVAVAAETKREVSGLLGNLLEEFRTELEKKLNCQFKVDFSAKLSETVGAVEEKFMAVSEANNRALRALKTLMTDVATLYTTSRNLTEEERLTLLRHIAEVNALLAEPKEPEPEQDVVTIAYAPEAKVSAAQTGTSVQGKESAKPAALRGI